MWFKNLRVYQLTGAIDLSGERLETALQPHRFEPCGKLEFARAGWMPPLGRQAEMFTHSIGPYTMICARRQEKVMPAGAVNELLEEKVEVFEAGEARRIYRSERARIKDEVVHSLLPRALTRSALTFAYFDTRKRRLFVDTASPARAEELVESLREALVELPVVPLRCAGDMADTMTRWVQHGAPDYFELDNQCDLQNRLESANVVRCRNQELESKEVLNHITAGKRVMQLAAVWRGAIRFVLGEDLSIRRLRFDDKIMGEAESDVNDAAAQFDQDFAVMSLQLNAFIDDVIEAFGGASV